MHLRAPLPEVQNRDSAHRLRPADRARERHSRDSERSPSVETGVASVGRLQASMDAKRDAKFEAEISLFEDHNADVPEPIFSAQISTIQMAKSADSAQNPIGLVDDERNGDFSPSIFPNSTSLRLGR